MGRKVSHTMGSQDSLNFVELYTDSNEFWCSKCNNLFTKRAFDKHIRYSHIRVEHNDEILHYCNFCDNSYKKIRTLKGHTKTEHKEMIGIENKIKKKKQVRFEDIEEKLRKIFIYSYECDECEFN